MDESRTFKWHTSYPLGQVYYELGRLYPIVNAANTKIMNTKKTKEITFADALAHLGNPFKYEGGTYIVRPYSYEKEQKAIQEGQKQAAINGFKQKSRFEALETAKYLRPPVNYVAEAKLADGVKRAYAEYNVTKQAEEIYQWLIKILE